MNLHINKIYLINRYLIIILSLFWLSCEEDNEVEYRESDAIFQEIADPYLQIVTPVIGFQAGNENYEYQFNVINGAKELNEVKVYSTFTDAESGKQSNEVLLSTIPVEGPTRNVITGSLTYEDLKEGLTVNDGPLPQSDLDLKVGSGWRLRFEGINTSGDAVALPGNINIAVLSRFAGMYKVIEAKYYRIGELRNDVTDPWIGEEIFIGSVDENTFSHNDWWGPFEWIGSGFNFDINFDDNSISVPITVNGLYAGDRALNCANDNFVKIPCAGSNVLIPDEVEGKHKIILTYGYFVNADNGAREFYTVLEKIVE